VWRDGMDAKWMLVEWKKLIACGENAAGEIIKECGMDFVSRLF